MTAAEALALEEAARRTALRERDEAREQARALAALLLDVDPRSARAEFAALKARAEAGDRAAATLAHLRAAILEVIGGAP